MVWYDRFISHAEKLADEGESELCVQILNVLQDMLERKEVVTEKVFLYSNFHNKFPFNIRCREECGINRLKIQFQGRQVHKDKLDKYLDTGTAVVSSSFFSRLSRSKKEAPGACMCYLILALIVISNYR